MFNTLLKRSREFPKLTTSLNLPDERVWKILQAGSNPTSDYYIKPKIERLGCTFEIESLTNCPGVFRKSNKLVIVRYLTHAWAKWLYAHREYFSEIVYFMDDELLRPKTWETLPIPYRKKLAENYAILRHWLPKIATSYWVSTDTLQYTNPEIKPLVVGPSPLPGDYSLSKRSADQSRRNLIFYHASFSHYHEFTWLKPLMERILAQHPSVQFELIGDIQINRMFRELPRTRILHPMSWDSYLSYTSSVSGGLGLAPLLDSSFNSARSTVKQLDICRMGATGLYTEGSAYARGADRLNSLYAPNIHDAWEREITAWLCCK